MLEKGVINITGLVNELLPLQTLAGAGELTTARPSDPELAKPRKMALSDSLCAVQHLSAK